MSIVMIDDIQPGGAFKLVDVADLAPDVDTDGHVLTGDGAGNVGMEAASAHGAHHAQAHEIDGHDAATPLSVAKGGIGRASQTAYAVLCGGTTTTAAQQSIASVGTAGQVLTSNGPGALPSMQAAAGGGGSVSKQWAMSGG